MISNILIHYFNNLKIHLAVPKVCKVEVFQHGLGFHYDVMTGLPRTAKSGFVSIIPLAPGDRDNQLKHVLAYMLNEDKVPEKVHKFLESHASSVQLLPMAVQVSREQSCQVRLEKVEQSCQVRIVEVVQPMTNLMHVVSTKEANYFFQSTTNFRLMAYQTATTILCKPIFLPFKHILILHIISKS